MKRLLILAAAVLALSLSAAAQTQDQTAKARSDMAKLVGLWTSSMENPMGGDNIEGEMSFVQDEKGIHFEIDGGDTGYFVSDPLKVDENGKIICLFPAAVDINCAFTLKDDDSAEIVMETSGMEWTTKLQRKK